MSKVSVFIDGEAGTTGLQIRDLLARRADIHLVSLPDHARKDARARAEALNAATVSILCLPDDAAREAVAMLTRVEARVIDASTAHRVHPDWTYGFPELGPGQREAIANARFVANPGCYPTGFLALVRPLVDEGIIPRDWPVTINAVSGYSGGGKPMIAEFENEEHPAFTREPFRIYGLSLKHKHVPEMQTHAGLSLPPLFAPAVGRYRQGMIVEVPLQLAALPGRPSVADAHRTLAAAYADTHFVSVAPLEESRGVSGLDPERLNGTNRMRLFVFGDESGGQARLVALLDNLGKGAAGAAVQNLNLMIGADETTGLE